MTLNHIAHCLFTHQTSTQITWFALLIMSLWLVETVALPQSTTVKWRHTSLNSLFVLTALPIQIVMMLVVGCVASWTTHCRWGLVHLLPHADHPLIKYGLMFLVLDLLDYVYHVTMHHVAPFWRFHLVHHTDQAVDVSTTVREHPGETFIRNCFLILWVFLCGPSVEILMLRQIADTASNLFAHTSVQLPPRSARVLGWLFITPNLHHVHHHFELPATNCNYGDVFSFWDRLFGTFMNLPRKDTVFGLQTHLDGAGEARMRAMIVTGRAHLSKWWKNCALTMGGRSADIDKFLPEVSAFQRTTSLENSPP